MPCCKVTERDLEGFENMKKRRNIPFAFMGMNVEVDGHKGVLVGNKGLNLLVVFNGNDFGSNCHPWWRTKYFDNNGDLIKEYQD